LQAQRSKPNDKVNFAALIQGNWFTALADSTFKHRQELRLKLLKNKTFEFQFLIDNVEKEKLTGKYSIANNNTLNLSADNKVVQVFKVLQISLLHLTIRNKSTLQKFEFTRE